MTDKNPIVEVKNLRVEIPTRKELLVALDNVSLEIYPGEVLGVVGESSAGKSMTGNAIIGLLDRPAHVASGQIILDGQRIDQLSEKELSALRGKKIGAIFQDPLTSLNPLFTVGDQLVETILTHKEITEKEAREIAIELLRKTGIPAADKRIDDYPHQFSGGMRQRVVIALALAGEPKLIIADEPTTALDVSIQAQIIDLLKSLCKEKSTAVMLVSHDMGVIAEASDRVAIMYAGRLVEIGQTQRIIQNPLHPYTAGLMGAIPKIGENAEYLTQIPGHMPRLNEVPKGCAFHPRCPLATEKCIQERPKIEVIDNIKVACWHVKSGEAIKYRKQPYYVRKELADADRR